jgi:hypothetical protein
MSSRYGGFRVGKKRILNDWDNRKTPSTMQPAPESIEEFDYATAQGVWNLNSTTQFPRWAGPRTISNTTANSNGTTTVSSLSITAPTGIQANELILIIAGNSNDTSTAQFNDSTLKPTGFTLIKTVGNATPDCHVAAFYKVATGNEGGTSISIPAQSANHMWAMCLRIANVNTSSPIDVIGNNWLTDSATSHIIPAITPTYENTLAVYCLAADGSDVGPFSDPQGGWVEIEEIMAGNNATSASGVVGIKRLKKSRSTGVVIINYGASADGGAGFMFNIRGL